MKKDKIKKVMKWLAISFAAIILLSAVAIWRAGVILEGTINSVLPKFLGVPTTVEDVDVSILSGKVKILNLEVGNPEGFNSPYMFHMDSLNIDVAVRDFFKGICHINKIHVIGPHVWYHQKLTSNNISTFLGMLEERFPVADGNAKEEKSTKKNKKSSQMPVVIDHFLLDEGTVGIKIGAGVEVPLLKVELKDVGRDGAFMPIQIVGVLVKAILSSVVSAVGNVGELAFDGVSAVGGAAVKGVSAVGGAAIKGVVSIGKGIGSIFGGEDDSSTNAPNNEIKSNETK